jgi:hypothetical protein
MPQSVPTENRIDTAGRARDSAVAAEEPAQVYVAGAGTDRTFHKSDCSYLDPKHGELSLKEAVKNGYKPCPFCKPLLVKGNEQYEETHVGTYEKREQPRTIVEKSVPTINPYDNTVPGRTFNETNRWIGR